MPNLSQPKPLHVGHKLLSIVAISVLVACGGVSVWQSKQQPAASQIADDFTAMVAMRPYYKSATGSYLAGRFAALNGDIHNALRHITEAMAYKNANDEITGKAYRLSLMIGDLEKALIYSRKLSAKYQDNLLTPAMLQAIMAVKHGNLQQAESILLNINASGINSLFVPLILGWVEFGQGKFDSLDGLTKVAARTGEFQSLLQYQLALLFDAANKVEQAAKLYDAVGQEDNLSHRIMKAVASFYYRNGMHEKLAKIQSKHQMQYDLPLGELSSEKLVATPEHGIAEIFYGIGSILYALNVNTEAVVPLQIALAMRPDFASVKLLLANLQEKGGKYDEAIAGYRRLESHPVFALQAKMRMALIYDEIGQHDKALTLLDELQQRYPNRNDPLLTKGDILRSNADYNAAIAAYSAVLENVDTIDAKLWPVFYARGICYERLGNWQKAEADFLEAMRLEPDQPDVLNYLGYSWLVQNKHITQAKEMIEKAIAARPRDAHIIDSMGWALYRIGKYKEALKHLEQAVNIAPRDATINEHLGDVYWRLGYKLQAKYQWERALFFEPQEAGQKEAIEEKLLSGMPPVEDVKIQMVASDNITTISATSGDDNQSIIQGKMINSGKNAE